MTMRAELRCRCGEVRGWVADAAPRTVNRVVCHCDDCQAFAHQLGRAELLDVHGGSDIVQLAPGSLSFVQGQDCIVGLRLTPDGLFRWYTSCCHTPVGNTVRPAIPFVGIMVHAFAHGSRRPDEVFGRPIGAMMGKFAIGDPPGVAKGWSLRLMPRAIRLVLGWRLRGRAWPNPFFSRETGAPIYPLTVLTPAEREALRRYCGPHPTARADGQPAH
jgi:hypothetical protein